MLQKVPFIEQDFLGKQAVFYVGGKICGEAGNQYLGGQMFVEAYEPKKIRFPYPLIFFHGAAQTNAGWLSTPDGRMGWADYFVSQGYTVYLAEQPARGRSAYHPREHGNLEYFDLDTMKKRWLSDAGNWTQAKLHTQWPGDAEKYEDDAFFQFAASQVEFIGCGHTVQKMILEAGGELLKLTGPAVLLTHSQAGQFGWLLADYYRNLILGIIAIEPMGPPFSSDLHNSTAQNYGITQYPLHFEPSIQHPSEFQLELCDAGPGQQSGWILKEPAPKLPNFRRDSYFASDWRGILSCSL